MIGIGFSGRLNGSELSRPLSRPLTKDPILMLGRGSDVRLGWDLDVLSGWTSRGLPETQIPSA